MTASNIGRAERAFSLGEVKDSPEARRRAAEEKANRPKLQPLPLTPAQLLLRAKRKQIALGRRKGKAV